MLKCKVFDTTIEFYGPIQGYYSKYINGVFKRLISIAVVKEVWPPSGVEVPYPPQHYNCRCTS